MNILFVHTNFPGQFGKLAALFMSHGHQVRALTPSTVAPSREIPTTGYALLRPPPQPSAANLFTVRFEADALRAQSAFEAAKTMAAAGFTPDVIIGHPAFGETMLLDLVWPQARRIVYAENFVSARNLSASFDVEFGPPSEAELVYAQTQLASAALSLMRANRLVSPSQFQRASFPEIVRDSIVVIPDGVDTSEVRPRGEALLAIEDKGVAFRPGDEVVTYVNRYLEPLRGIHVFLRALPRVLAERPKAHVVILGGASAHAYGRPPPKGRTWKDIFVDEVRDRLDLSRVHFLGRTDRQTFLDVLAVSRAHVYLTYPFVPSWSLLEAMSAGCAILASDTEPVREFIAHGRNGILIDFFDHAALADALCEALAKPDDHAAYRSAARSDAVSRFDFDTVAAPLWLRCLKEL